DHDVVPRIDLLQQVADVRRIVLQIAIHGHDHFPARLGDARGHGRCLPVVAAELHQYHTRIGARDLIDERHRLIGAAIIDKYDLERHAQRLDGADDRRVHGAHAVLLVEQRHNDGYVRTHASTWA